MTTSFYRGEEGSIKFNLNDQNVGTLSYTRSWSLTLEKEVLNVDTLNSQYSKNIGGVVSGTGSAELFLANDKNEQTTSFIKRVNFGNDDADASFTLIMEGNYEIAFDALINSAEFTATVGELDIITVSFTTNGEITTDL